MRVATTVRARRIDVREVPDPQPAAGQALIAVDAVGLCGTDLHIWQGAYPSGALPVIQGHEVVGTLLQVGRGTDSNLEAGARVVLDPTTSCGHCYACRVGRGNACRNMSVMGVHGPGALCDQVVAPLSRVHASHGTDVDVAALAEPASISLQSVARSRARAGERAIVMGCGPIGLLATLALREKGLRVAVVDRLPDRLALATALGAEPAVPATDTGVDANDDVVATLCGWADGEGAPVVIEATGAPAALSAAIRVVANAGRVVTVGISDAYMTLPMITLPYKEIDLLGSRNSQGRLPEAVDFVCRHAAKVSRLVTHCFSMETLDDAFGLMEEPTSAVCKPMVRLR